MACTPPELFQHHGETLMAEDLEGIVSDYADDALFITSDGVKHGNDGVREGFTKLLSPRALGTADAEFSGRHLVPGVEGGVGGRQGTRWNRYIRVP